MVPGPPGRRAGAEEGAGARDWALWLEGGCGCTADSAVPRNRTGVTPTGGGSLGTRQRSDARRLGAPGESVNGRVCHPMEAICSMMRENDRDTRILSRVSSQSMNCHWIRARWTRSRFSSIRPDSSRARIGLAARSIEDDEAEGATDGGRSGRDAERGSSSPASDGEGGGWGWEARCSVESLRFLSFFFRD